jgi:hypothetical protein
MKSKIAKRSIATAIVLVATACAEQPLAPGQPKSANLDLAPFATHEDCVDLVPGDRLDYRFESNAPVKFNISYRDSDMIVQPITRDDILADAGVFAPRIKSRYCLNWEARASGALVDYHAAVRRGGQ